MLTDLLIFMSIIMIFEGFKYLKKYKKEKTAVCSVIEGKITNREIINQSYYKGISMGGAYTSIRNRFMLIFTVEDNFESQHRIKVAESEFYNPIENIHYYDIGENVIWKIKKYPTEDICILVENLK